MSELYVVELLLPSGTPFRHSKPVSMEDAEELQALLCGFPSRIVPHQDKDTTLAVKTSTPADDRRGARGSMRND